MLRVHFVLSAVAGSMLWSVVGSAQDFPTKPIRFIVPSNPGTIQDTLARVVGPEMAKSLGQPSITENKPGAAFAIGYEYVAKQAPADGYSLAVVNLATLVALPATSKDLRFDPLKDLIPVIGLVEGRYAFGSSSKMPWKSLKEMIAQAKANPGKLNYATASPLGQLQTAAFISDLGLDVVHVPYPGAGAAYSQAIASGEVHMVFTAEAQAIALGDKFRVLAISGAQRSARFPDAPTFTELGFPKIRGLSYSFNVRSGTPTVIVNKLYAAASRALQQPEVRSILVNKMQQEIIDENPQVAAKRLAEQGEYFADMARKLKFQSK